MMKTSTQAALQKLSDIQWFAQIGVRDSDAVDFLESWDAAIEACNSELWNDFTNEALNKIGDSVFQKSRSDFNRWNNIVKDTNPMIDVIVDNIATKFFSDVKIFTAIRDSVLWDLGGYAMELEYSEFHAPAFFSNQIYWYRRGHFPCGWNKAAERLIIF